MSCSKLSVYAPVGIVGALVVAELISIGWLRWTIEAILLAFVLYQLIKSNPPARGNRAPLLSAVSELHQTLNHEVDIIHQELNRVDGLIKSAVQVMSQNAYEISELSAKKKSLLNSINETTAANQTEEVRLSRQQFESLQYLIDELNLAANQSLQAVQFEDMASQALNSLQDNIQTLSKIAEKLEDIPKSQFMPLEDKIISLINSLQLLREHSQKRNENRTVAQTNLTEGEVELF